MGARLVAAKARVAGKAGGKSKAKTARGMRAAAKYKDDLHPRDQSGKFRDKPGAGDDAPRKPRKPGRKPFGRLPKEVARAQRTGKVVGAKEHAYATAREREIARALKVEHIGDHQPSDVSGKIGDRIHNLEVKTLLKGNKQALTMHPDARLRKVEHYRANPNEGFHTVVIDARAKYQGGAFASHYSGHDIYYRRGADAYSLGRMHKVKDMDELKRLIRMKDDELPEAARGSLNLDEATYAKLQSQAEHASAARKARDKKRKQLIREARAAT